VHNMINVSQTGNPEMKQIGLLLRIKKKLYAYFNQYGLRFIHYKCGNETNTS